MSKQRKALEFALRLIESLYENGEELPDRSGRFIHWAQDFGERSEELADFIQEMKEALAEPEPWTTADMAYTPGGLPMDAPPTLKPLTEEEIEGCREAANRTYQRHKSSVRGQIIMPEDDWEYHYARAIERAHGIGE